MSIIKVEMYTVQCDGCGELANEGTDFSCMSDESSAEDYFCEYWHIDRESATRKHYCPNCFDINEETDEIEIKHLNK